MLILRMIEFLYYHTLLTLVDRISRLPRNSTPPDVMRLYRENIGLKAQIDALRRELHRRDGKGWRASTRTRAAQVFAYFLNRHNVDFREYYLSASPATVRRWASRFRRAPWRRSAGGRPPLAQEIVDLIVTLKRENPLWGAPRIKNELARMGIRVSEPTIQKVLKENGFDPRRPGTRKWERLFSTAKDMLWAMDFFVVKTAKGEVLKVLLIVDLYTRELLSLQVYAGNDCDSAWTTRAFVKTMSATGRRPESVVHDRDPLFRSRFEQQLRVLEVEQTRLPGAMPFINGVAERAVKSVRFELLNHIRVSSAAELQWYMDEYMTYYNACRTHQAIEGLTPAELSSNGSAAEIIDLAELRRRKLVRREFAKGILNSYVLDADEESPVRHLAA